MTFSPVEPLCNHSDCIGHGNAPARHAPLQESHTETGMRLMAHPSVHTSDNASCQSLSQSQLHQLIGQPWHKGTQHKYHCDDEDDCDGTAAQCSGGHRSPHSARFSFSGMLIQKSEWQPHS